MTKEKKKVDLILVSVLDRRFAGVVDEMARSMIRASRSPTFFEVRDCCTALFTKDLRLIAMQDFIPPLAYSIRVSIEHIAKKHKGDIHEGDVFIHNDPYDGNNHLPDVNIAKPIFYNNELVFWSVAKGHFDDIGGGGICSYNPASTTVREDGLIIPACKLYQKGSFNKDIWNLIARNTNDADRVFGDIACEVGSVTLGERRIIELVDRYGVETLYDAIDEILSATERDIRDRVRQIPDGIYSAEQAMDPDPGSDRNSPIMLRLTITKQGDQMTLDLSDSDPQVIGYMNSSWANIWAETIVTVFFTLPPDDIDIKRNEGSWKPFKVIAPEGLIVNSRFPAPITTCTSTTNDALVEMIMRALSQAIPEYVVAGCGRISSTNVIGYNPKTNGTFASLDFTEIETGAGATEGYDGWPTLGIEAGQGWGQLPDTEIMQLVWPMRILQNEEIMDEIAPGRFCGGPAKIYRIQYLADLSCLTWGSGYYDYSAPRGLFGGSDAKPNKDTLYRADGTVENIEVNTFYQVKAGDIKEKYVQGGGGYGDPWERESWRVRNDVYNELISIEKARENYGVVINPDTMEVNIEATRTLRKKHKK